MLIILRNIMILAAFMLTANTASAVEIPNPTVGVCQDNILLNSLTDEVKSSNDLDVMNNYLRFLRKCENLLSPTNLDK